MAIISAIYGDSFPLRNAATDARETGLEVWLLPEGGTAPDDLIECFANAGLPWYYDVPPETPDGVYDLYTGPSGGQVAVTHSGQQVKIPIIRGGKMGKGWDD